MAINFSPKVGQVLECNFGEYSIGPNGQQSNAPDNHLPPEMVKNRLVVVLNGKVSGTSCVVVPLSTTKDAQKTHRGWHVEISIDELPDLKYFKKSTRWAKADMLQQVSKTRLNRPRSERGYKETMISSQIVEKIQRAVIRAIGARNLLADEQVM